MRAGLDRMNHGHGVSGDHDAHHDHDLCDVRDLPFNFPGGLQFIVETISVRVQKI
jgi:hypothetical protein